MPLYAEWGDAESPRGGDHLAQQRIAEALRRRGLTTWFGQDSPVRISPVVLLPCYCALPRPPGHVPAGALRQSQPYHTLTDWAGGIPHLQAFGDVRGVVREISRAVHVCAAFIVAITPRYLERVDSDDEGDLCSMEFGAVSEAALDAPSLRRRRDVCSHTCTEPDARSQADCWYQ